MEPQPTEDSRDISRILCRNNPCKMPAEILAEKGDYADYADYANNA
jgi:hypothetical protein